MDHNGPPRFDAPPKYRAPSISNNRSNIRVIPYNRDVDPANDLSRLYASQPPLLLEMPIYTPQRDDTVGAAIGLRLTNTYLDHFSCTTLTMLLIGCFLCVIIGLIVAIFLVAFL